MYAYSKIEFFYNRNQDPSAAENKRLELTAASRMSRAVGKWVRKRVTQRGDTIQKFKGYSRNRHFYVSPRYPLMPGARIIKGGKNEGRTYYPSSYAFHQGMRVQGSFWVSGGMWRGLQVRPGKWTSSLVFRGRSEGQESGKRGRGKRVSNALKAATVRNKNKINLLDIYPREVKDIHHALQKAMARAFKKMFVFDVPDFVSAEGRLTGGRLSAEVFKQLRKGMTTGAMSPAKI